MNNIGDSVTFIRNCKDGVVEGTARLKGIGLNGEGRQIALLKDAEGNSFNTYIACLNPSPEVCQQFRDLITKTDALGKVGGEKQKEIVAEYNAKIAILDDALLGPALEL